MANKFILKGIASIASNYTKRGLENKYRNMFNSGWGKELKKLDLRTRYIIEFFLYVFAAIADSQMSESSPIKKYIKEVIEDAAPEIAKSLINGDADYAETSKNLPESEELINYLKGMNEEDLKNIVSSLRGTQSSEKNDLLKNLLSTVTAGSKNITGKARSVFSETETHKGFLETVRDKLKENLQKKKEDGL